MNYKNLSGKKFGRLIVLKDVGRDGSCVRWKCACYGSEKNPHRETFKTVRSSHLISGAIKSCGCLQLESKILKSEYNKKHGMYKSGEYRSYSGAKSRCENVKDDTYPSYGGEGVKFKFINFEEFYNELGPKPSPKHSVDRYPNNKGHYEPGNVRWATPELQNQNKKSNKLFPDAIRDIRENGSIKSHKYYARKYNTHPNTILDVLNYRTWKNII